MMAYSDQHLTPRPTHQAMRLHKLRPRFSLRMLLALLTGLALLCGWGAHVVRKVRRTNEIATTLESKGTIVGFENCTLFGISVDEKRVPDWAWKLGGEAAFTDVTYVWLDDLGEEPLTESDFALLAELPHLQSISCQFVELPANALEVFAALPNLDSLDLSWVDVSDCPLEKLATARNLRSVRLSGDSDSALISDRSLERISKLRQIHTLELVLCNGVTPYGLQSLRKMPQLRELAFQDFDAANDESLALLADLPQLESLELENLRISSIGCSPISKLTRLKSLSLSDCDVDDSVLAMLRPLKSLTELGLYGTRITDTGVDELNRMSQLEKLILGRTDISAVGVKRLAALKRLKTLSVPCESDLSACEFLKSELPDCRVFAVDSRGNTTEIAAAAPPVNANSQLAP